MFTIFAFLLMIGVVIKRSFLGPQVIFARLSLALMASGIGLAALSGGEETMLGIIGFSMFASGVSLAVMMLVIDIGHKIGLVLDRRR